MGYSRHKNELIAWWRRHGPDLVRRGVEIGEATRLASKGLNYRIHRDLFAEVEEITGIIIKNGTLQVRVGELADIAVAAVVRHKPFNPPRAVVERVGGLAPAPAPTVSPTPAQSLFSAVCKPAPVAPPVPAVVAAAPVNTPTPHKEPAMARTVPNRLSFSQQKSIDSWLGKNWGWIVESYATRDEAAAKCGGELGFMVKKSNIDGVIRETGRVWPNRRDHDTPDPVGGLATANMVARHLAALYRKLGETVPAELGRYCDETA